MKACLIARGLTSKLTTVLCHLLLRVTWSCGKFLYTRTWQNFCHQFFFFFPSRRAQYQVILDRSFSITQFNTSKHKASMHAIHQAPTFGPSPVPVGDGKTPLLTLL